MYKRSSNIFMLYNLFSSIWHIHIACSIFINTFQTTTTVNSAFLFVNEVRHLNHIPCRFFSLMDCVFVFFVFFFVFFFHPSVNVCTLIWDTWGDEKKKKHHIAEVDEYCLCNVCYHEFRQKENVQIRNSKRVNKDYYCVYFIHESLSFSLSLPY